MRCAYTYISHNIPSHILISYAQNNFIYKNVECMSTYYKDTMFGCVWLLIVVEGKEVGV